MTAVELPPTPIDKVIGDISIAMHQWSVEQHTAIKTTVRARLDQHRNEILMKLMGFEKQWGGSGDKWDIDHCNGRSGNSNISDFLKTSQGAAVEEWLSQIKLPTMSAAFKKKIEKSLQQQYEHEINNKIYPMAKARAQRDIEELLTTVLPDNLLDKYLRALALIDQQPTEA